MKYLAILLLAGCTAINPHQLPPKDWPDLKVSVQEMSFLEVQKVCGGSIFAQVIACAYINFTEMVCKIFTSSNDEYVLEHELWHCKGYDHYASTELRDWWSNWKSQFMKGE